MVDNTTQVCFTNRCGTEKECKSQPPKQICQMKTAKECKETPASIGKSDIYYKTSPLDGYHLKVS